MPASADVECACVVVNLFQFVSRVRRNDACRQRRVRKRSEVRLRNMIGAALLAHAEA